MAGRLITLEGGEGAGKSTAMAAVHGWLTERGRDVVVTREPGGTPAAERIRQVLLEPDVGELTPMAELLLMFAARAENLARVIRPALMSDKDVLCDRFTDASLAYQGAGRELGRAPITALAELVHPDIRPSLTILLDVPVAVGLARVRTRATEPDRFEQAQAGFLERVRDAYLAVAQAEPERFVVVDASQSLERVHSAIVEALEERLS